MNAKLSLAVLGVLGVAAIFVSAQAQQESAAPRSAISVPVTGPGAVGIVGRPEPSPSNSGQYIRGSTAVGPARGAGRAFMQAVPDSGRVHAQPVPGSGRVLIEEMRNQNGQTNAFYVVSDDEEANLGQSANELTKKLGEAKSDSERSQIKSNLAQVLGKQFDLRQKRHQDEIAELEAKVKKLKDLVEKRQENRHEIINKRIEQIAREADGLGW